MYELLFETIVKAHRVHSITIIAIKCRIANKVVDVESSLPSFSSPLLVDFDYPPITLTWENNVFINFENLKKHNSSKFNSQK